jgi:hypothetical protein
MEQSTQHHIRPVTFFGKKHNLHTITLCQKCHNKIETIILGVESFIGHTDFGHRYQLKEESYYRIAESFIGRNLL